ncbi:MAG: 3-deoxy-8-phosphooctulonate synthase [Candidatus Thiodiazotropha taylori]|uniref:3-deoxy-8-phosphooctulonate synthase n=1 Tax=Candidatus Thiodiazotropha taylori TaxID=2792791 RepID=A0A9E4N339_9GAMM|nr:3-deoxy-8-phosphooctulonate synthase [Candidatus Thiodiazotropha taylori]MCW4254934.1 3-deoxy-8-phosphooctulonate synthase [Candidatus Thiodiazotropha taylori]
MRIIAGPCQHESFEQSLEIAKHCKEVCDKYNIEYIFKASFDKANRTSLHGQRGSHIFVPDSLSQFCRDSKALKEEIPGLLIMTDVHERWQLGSLEKHVDVIQIPAFLCRQTDLILGAIKARIKAVNIKKGQFLAPWDVDGIMSKVEDHKCDEIWITERGTSFGYNTLVNDFTGMEQLLSKFGSNFVYDVTHSVQKPGGQGSSSGGNRSHVPGLARAGAALGITSFFLEVHPDPDNAPSDGPNSLYLKDFADVVKQIKIVSDAARGWTWL